MPFPCPDCNCDSTTAIDSRPREGYRHRKYKCNRCSRRFATAEIHLENPDALTEIFGAARRAKARETAAGLIKKALGLLT